jgi:hypothetical protein
VRQETFTDIYARRKEPFWIFAVWRRLPNMLERPALLVGGLKRSPAGSTRNSWGKRRPCSKSTKSSGHSTCVSFLLWHLSLHHWSLINNNFILQASLVSYSQLPRLWWHGWCNLQQFTMPSQTLQPFICPMEGKGRSGIFTWMNVKWIANCVLAQRTSLERFGANSALISKWGHITGEG